MIVEAVTVTLYRATNAPKGWRRRRRRATRTMAYRDAAWAKIRTRCKCAALFSTAETPSKCRYHDRFYRSPGEEHDTGAPIEFEPPREWKLPPGDWDYGRAVAYRLARFYARRDRQETAAPPARGKTDGKEGNHG